ncbi:uncharacterized protein BP5553_06216 [Venustampulla echinocandica]|uniref:DNA mismatch repair protein S5 domain-containing protein n=1 Tax=Venustampulla echinocandica TaxID=2656787 RepID=A0A370TMX1_9HELO|nr:uncharacterized protein BP5553_06216 [Venustampulla echinocandica]RDL36864.1 hypothetical protein BP5553_06216 [Venustampulla echinocandica]
MTIAALPQNTVNLLGSAQCLTTPTSLVKELIDNALDAKATSIDILISQNTIDKIQVRDNGHGIPHEDLSALGKRGHTSKLRSFAELKSIGGTSLGFRGEALASAVQLGEVSLTTRTDGEPVATIVVLKAPGRIDRQSRTSHPIGTTVCVANFMAKLPVRKQTALKSASKTLTKVRELVQAYALARSSTRFSLKVVNESKSGWSFALRPNDGVREAVSQVIGRVASLQCMQESLTFPETQAEEGAHTPNVASRPNKGSAPNDKFQVDIFLPKPDAEPAKIGQGQFLSIDGRPISHEKGTMRRIVAIYKSYIRGAFADTSELKNPFILLGIKCPVASYDPNVEPAKDDVLFANESLVLGSIESVFKQLYGDLKVIPSATRKPALSQKLDNPELLYTRKPAMSLTALQLSTAPSDEPLPASPSNNLVTPQALVSSVINGSVNELQSATLNVEGINDEVGTTPRKWGFDMSNILSEDIEERRKSFHSNMFRTPGPACNESQQTESGHPLNPWVIAKMTAPIQRNNQRPPVTMRPSSFSPVQQDDPISNPVQLQLSNLIPSEPFLLEPPGFDTPPQRQYADEIIRGPRFSIEGSPSLPNQSLRRRRHSNQDSSLLVDSVDASPSRQRRVSDGSRSGELQPNIRSPMVGYGRGLRFMNQENESAQNQRPSDFISARKVAGNHLISPPLTQRQSHKATGVLNKPFVLPRRATNNFSSIGELHQATLAVASESPQTQGDIWQTGPQREPNPELEWSMEFEQRKEHASRHRRQELRAARKAACEIEEADRRIRSSPHKNRYNAAIATLGADHLASQNNLQSNKPIKTSLLHSDPRAYLMKQQKLMVAHGGALELTRAKSMKLPLERIPDDANTQSLILTLSSDINEFRKLTTSMATADKYVAHGIESAGLEPLPSDVSGITSRIQTVVERWINSEERNTCEVEYTFENLLNSKSSFMV